MIFSVLCEDVRQEVGAKFSFMGVTQALFPPVLPVRYQRICVANCWTNGEGRFRSLTRIMAPDMTTTAALGQEVTFELSDIRKSHVLIVVFRNVPFVQEGSYWIEVLLDGEIACRYPLWVKKGEVVITPPRENSSPSGD